MVNELKLPRSVVQALNSLVSECLEAGRLGSYNAANIARRDLEKELTAWNARADTGRLSELEAEVAALKAQGFTLKQATHCASCGQFKHTPLRRDEMGGYVCMTCIDNALDARAALEAQS